MLAQAAQVQARFNQRGDDGAYRMLPLAGPAVGEPGGGIGIVAGIVEQGAMLCEERARAEVEQANREAAAKRAEADAARAAAISGSTRARKPATASCVATASKPGNPDSATVGTSGRARERCRPLVAIARMRVTSKSSAMRRKCAKACMAW